MFICGNRSAVLRTGRRYFSRVLLWDADTPHAKSMEKFREATPLMTYALDNAGSFGKRDWLAALTLLTTRKGSARNHQVYRDFMAKVVSQREVFGKASIHLMLHRLAVIGASATVWQLVPFVTAQLSALQPRQVCLISWALAKAKVLDEDFSEKLKLWLQKIEPEELSKLDAAHLAWSYARRAEIAKMENQSPPGVEELQCLRRLIVVHSAPSHGGSEKVEGAYISESHSSSTLMKAAAELFPKDLGLFTQLSDTIQAAVEGGEFAFTSQELTALWLSTVIIAASHRAHIKREWIEFLQEQSRRLRLDIAFNQFMCLSIARAATALDALDPRVIYQLIHFVDKRGLNMKAETGVELAEIFAKASIDDLNAWKRLAVLFERRGISLQLRDLHRFKRAFERSGRINQRVMGFYDLFVKAREDERKYGPA